MLNDTTTANLQGHEPPLGNHVGRLTLVWTASIFALCAILAAIILASLTSEDNSDILIHNEILLKAKQDGAPIWGYSIYYSIVNFLAFGNFQLQHLRWVAVTVLALAMALKASTSFAFLMQRNESFQQSAAATAFLMIAVPLNLLGGNIYLGKFTGTIWHNSTTMLLIPASIALFWMTVRSFSEARPTLLVAAPLLLVTVANVAIKPNYALAYLPALGVAVLGWGLTSWRTRRNISALGNLLTWYAIVAIPAVSVLLVQYLMTFERGGLEISLGLDPFAVWQYRNGILGIPISLFSSYALPAAVTAILWSRARSDRAIQLAWLCTAFGVAAYALLAEYTPDGQLQLHGNWMWGAQVSTFILYLSCASLWMKYGRPTAARWTRVVVYTLASLQFVWGLIYLYQLVNTRTYL